MRRNGLFAAGLVDSLGLAFGWTVMSLEVVSRHGLGGLGLLSSAMLIGVAASAPFTGWLAARLDGRQLLRVTAVAEAALRAVTFVALFAGAPLWAVAGLVVVSNVLAWSGFAGMRAEVCHLGGGARWMAAYTAGIAAAEALGAFIASSLPTVGDGMVAPSVTTIAVVCYSASLLPTFFVAAGARAERSQSASWRAQVEGRGRLLAGGALLTLAATGPTLLAVGLAANLHGRASVGPAMLCFAVGSLLGPSLAGWISHHHLPVPVCWAFLGILVITGWALAPMALAGMLVAQLASGVGVGAFEGVMDEAVTREGRRETITGGLAWAGATRALGSAVAVALTPGAVGAVGVHRVASVATLVLVGVAVGVGLVAPALAGRRSRRAAALAG